ncbi:hypothetical protein NKH26_18180 [Mesorhizobium sp. M1305]
MVRISTQGRDKVELGSGYLPQGYDTEEAAKAHIAELQQLYDLSGYDGREARWWARNASATYEITYWWLEYPAGE